MTCYHPNIMIQDRDKINIKTGKGWQKIAFYNSRSPNFKGYEFYNKFNEDPVLNDNGKYKAVQIRCFNQCIGCLEDRAKEWATKCYLESLYHDESYFITLTYDDNHLPISNTMTTSKGEIFYDDGTWNSYIEYEHVRSFIRKVRDWQREKYGINGIKYFGCGEYGGKEGRAHFHIIMFGLHLEPNDVRVHEISKDGNVTYKCEELSKCWVMPNERRGQAEPMGFITVAEVNWQTSRYVAGYVQKKEFKNTKDEYEYFTNKEAYYSRRGQTPERLFMSTQGGIGKRYFDEHAREFFEDGYIMIHGAKQKIVKARIPTYYERLLEHESEPTLDKYKEQKQEKAKANTKLKMSQTSLSIAEQLEVEERIKKDKMLIFNLRDKVD